MPAAQDCHAGLPARIISIKTRFHQPRGANELGVCDEKMRDSAGDSLLRLPATARGVEYHVGGRIEALPVAPFQEQPAIAGGYVVAFRETQLARGVVYPARGPLQFHEHADGGLVQGGHAAAVRMAVFGAVLLVPESGFEPKAYRETAAGPL